MAKTKYDMTLTDEERAFLTKLIAEGKESERTIVRARILLLSDLSNNPYRSVPKIAEMVGTSHTTVQTTRCEFGNYGLITALFRKERRKTKGTEEVAKQIVAISKEKPPKGKKKWSLAMLCEESVARGIVPAIDRTTMMRIMHEHNPNYAQEFIEDDHRA